MRTVMLGPPSPELEALIERRRALGQDLYDEVWNGEYHMAPAPRFAHGDLDQQLAELLGPIARAAGFVMSGPFNLGTSKDNFRVPDRGLHRTRSSAAAFLPTAALVVEIVSPDDETWDKLDHYADHDVDELLIVDPQERAVTWLALEGENYERIDRSRLLDLDVRELADQIDWPVNSD